VCLCVFFFFFSSRRRHTRCYRDWSSDVCSSDLAPNGGVEDLFTVSGRADAGACSLRQPSFNAARATNNIIFRIPTPVFGAGLMRSEERRVGKEGRSLWSGEQ